MTPRTYPTWDERLAAVAAMVRLAGQGTRPTPAQVAGVARRYGVSAATAYRWWSDPRVLAALADPRTGKVNPGRAPRLVVTTEMLTVLAHEQSVLDTHRRLYDAGLVDVSYSAFARAVRRTDPALVQGALDGITGMVNHMVYKRFRAPHRGHTYHFDHTQADFYCMPRDHREKTPIRPWITVVVDGRTSYVLAVMLLKSHPNQRTVAAALAQAALVREEHGVVVGGSPEQVVCDNAAEHFAETVQDGAAALGWIFTPTNPRRSNQNGRAENLNGLITRGLARKMPGALHVGDDSKGSGRALVRKRGKAQPVALLQWVSAVALAELFRDKVNHSYEVKELGGRTRAQAWSFDNTVLRPIEPEILRNVMLPTSKPHYRASGSGISFGPRNYLGPGIHRGQDYRIRFLPGAPDFIVVYDLDGRFVTEARPAELLDGDELREYEAGRARTEREVKAINAGVTAHRSHLGLVVDALYEDEPVEYDGSDELFATLGLDLDHTDFDVDLSGGDWDAEDDPWEQVLAGPVGDNPEGAADGDPAKPAPPTGAEAATQETPTVAKDAGPRGPASLPRASRAATTPANATLTSANDRLAALFGGGIRHDAGTSVPAETPEEEA